MVLKSFGERIKELRVKTGLSQEKFAYKIEMDRTYYAAVESGKHNISLNNIKNWMSARGIDSRLIEESCLLFIREKKELFYTHYFKEGTGIDIDVREGDYTDEKSTKRLIIA